MSPISSVLGFVPNFNRINIAIPNLRDLEKELDAIVTQQVPINEPFNDFNYLKLKDLSFNYFDKDGKNFFL